MQLRGQEAKLHHEIQAEIYEERNHWTTNHCQPTRGVQGCQPGGCFKATRDGEVACLVDGAVGQIYHAVAETYQKGEHGHLHWQKLDGTAAPTPEKSGQLKHAPYLFSSLGDHALLPAVSAHPYQSFLNEWKHELRVITSYQHVQAIIIASNQTSEGHV